MSKSVFGPQIKHLVQLLARLPGLGPRSARRVVLHLIKKKEKLFVPLSSAMQDVIKNIRFCSVCGNVDTLSPCSICHDSERDPTKLIVVEEISDLWALERAGILKTYYQVLGGHLSPLEGIGPDNLNIKGLFRRLASGEIKEVVLAVNATIEGQTTAHYLIDLMKNLDIKVTRLAHGLPVGGELDYLDEGTLAAALQARF